MSEQTRNNKIKNLAIWLHDNYEELSLKHSWITHKDCHLKTFKDLPHENKLVMLELSERILVCYNKIEK